MQRFLAYVVADQAIEFILRHGIEARCRSLRLESA
jgi:hypothetical protein